MYDTETAKRCLSIAKGCHDYGGGYRDQGESEIYHHGIQTVINCIEKLVEREGKKGDFQLDMVESIGENI